MPPKRRPPTKWAPLRCDPPCIGPLVPSTSTSPISTSGTSTGTTTAALGGGVRLRRPAPPTRCEADPRPPLVTDRLAPPEPGIAARKDAPVFAPSKRGSRAAALEATTNEDSKKRALAALEHDVRATTAASPVDSMLATWEKIHVAWFGEQVPLLPITVEKIKCVAAAFKQGRYRAFPNYVSTIKDHHQANEYVWDEFLERAVTRYSRSVARGLGPQKQSGAIDPRRVTPLAAKASMEPLTKGGPINPFGMFLLACLFLQREVEASLALWRNIIFDKTKQIITWRLPVTKCDAQALGCSRSWGCLCGKNRDAPCPWHFMCAHQAELTRRFGDAEGALHPDLPAFPSAEGRVCDKEAVTNSFCKIAEAAGVAWQT